MISCQPLTTTSRPLVFSLAVWFGLLFLSGCDDAYPVDLRYGLRTDFLLTAPLTASPTQFDGPGQLFHLLEKVSDAKDRQNILDPALLSEGQKQALLSALDGLFGTPLAPRAAGLSGSAVETLKLDEKTLAEGSRLYRTHCLHCHGLTGNGRGPTAPWINPHPRDFRRGVFKFTSSSQGSGQRKPRRADLLRVLREGVEGTAMPTFGLQPAQELDALASYVTHLSLRGQLEYFVMADLLKESKLSEAEKDLKIGGIKEKVQEYLEAVADWWLGADNEKNLIAPTGEPPADRLKAVGNGYRLFREVGEKGGAGCISCHEDFGRKVTFRNDVWGTIVRPADLTQGVYRGGRRPIDLFWRVHSGINGADMPAAGKTPDNPSGMTATQLWDIVAFLQALPYPSMLPEEVRQEVYGK